MHKPLLIALTFPLALAACDTSTEPGTDTDGNSEQTVLTIGEPEADLVSPMPLEPTDDTLVYVLDVEGMTCQHNCAPKVHDAIVRLDGVTEAHVDGPGGHAWVRVPADSALTVDEVVNAINATDGFTAEPAPESTDPAA